MNEKLCLKYYIWLNVMILKEFKIFFYICEWYNNIWFYILVNVLFCELFVLVIFLGFIVVDNNVDLD